LDGKNFILTGSDVPRDTRRSNNGSGRPLPLETSVRNVFASGDVRSGLVKRVGAAIGEGAVVGAELHVVLANGSAAPPGAADTKGQLATFNDTPRPVESTGVQDRAR
jgi:thioredoxin reductase (NADPH)